MQRSEGAADARAMRCVQVKRGREDGRKCRFGQKGLGIWGKWTASERRLIRRDARARFKLVSPSSLAQLQARRDSFTSGLGWARVGRGRVGVGQEGGRGAANGRTGLDLTGRNRQWNGQKQRRQS